MKVAATTYDLAEAWETIHAKEREIQVAKRFFDNCDPDLLEMASLKLTVLEMELVLLHSELRKKFGKSLT